MVCCHFRCPCCCRLLHTRCTWHGRSWTPPAGISNDARLPALVLTQSPDSPKKGTAQATHARQTKNELPGKSRNNAHTAYMPCTATSLAQQTCLLYNAKVSTSLNACRATECIACTSPLQRWLPTCQATSPCCNMVNNDADS